MPKPIRDDPFTEPPAEQRSPRKQLIREALDELAGIEAEYRKLDERHEYWRKAMAEAE